MSKLIDHGISDQELIDYWQIDTLRLHLIKSIIELDNYAVDDCLGMFKSVQQLRKQCYNPPNTIDEKMEVFNELINGHGIEAINVSPELYQDKYWGNIIGIYVNLGDTYDLTIIWNPIDNQFEFSSWGNYYETKEVELKKELDSENF
jgi:hypothetical protein